MDPQACLERILAAFDDDDLPEMYWAVCDLLGWIAGGGFIPRSLGSHLWRSVDRLMLIGRITGLHGAILDRVQSELDAIHIEINHVNEETCADVDTHDEYRDQETNEPLPGFYHWCCLPGCLPDSAPMGPYTSAVECHLEAWQWHIGDVG